MPQLVSPAVLIALFTAFISFCVLKLINGLKTVNHLPGLRVPFEPLALPGVLLPTTWWNPGYRAAWVYRFTFYRNARSDTASIVPFISGSPWIYTANLDVARQIIAGGHKSGFHKPEIASRMLLLWGMNLIAAEGDVWRKHRRVMGPAFNNKLYQFVWDKTIQIYRDMVDNEGWANKSTVEVPVVQKLTFKVALLVIGSCAFGFPFTWSEPAEAPDGSMSVQEALRIVTDSHMLALYAPKWFFRLPFKWIQRVRRAHEQLSQFMRQQVAERKSEIGNGNPGNNAFSMLVQANEQESGKLQLSDEELIGNVFIMLFAGHETTAHTLAATLGFLGIYQKLQDEVYKEIISIMGTKDTPILEDYSKFNKVRAAFYEALRMFPAGHILIREAKEDTVLTMPDPHGGEGTKSMPVPKGQLFIVDMIGIQYNPRYFDEPEKFKPERWYDLPPDSDSFTAFSIGPRVCIGRKFASVESVAFLAMLLRDWRVEPLLKDGESVSAWRARVMEGKVVATLGVQDVPLRFVRRNNV